jgi:hypothetical protein
MRKRKQLSIVVGIAAVILAGGIGSCNSIAANVTYLAPVVKPPDFDTRSYGGVGIGAGFDTIWTRINLDYYPFAEKPAGTESVGMAMGFFLKYPIERDKFTVSPMAGLNLGIGGFAIGATIDVPIKPTLAFRAETVYDFGPIGASAPSGNLFIRAGVAFQLDPSWWGGGGTARGQSKNLVSDELLVKAVGLVSGASQSLGMTADQLKSFWFPAELLESGDEIYILDYPDLVRVTTFFLKDGKVTGVHYSFGNYAPIAELNLKLAYTQRFGVSLERDSKGRDYWLSGTTIFSVGKENYSDAESGYILTLVCFKPE